MPNGFPHQINLAFTKGTSSSTGPGQTAQAQAPQNDRPYTVQATLVEAKKDPICVTVYVNGALVTSFDPRKNGGSRNVPIDGDEARQVTLTFIYE